MQAARSPADARRQAGACQELLTYLQDELRPRVGVPEPQPAHWGILLALFASATTTYEAAVLLAREEFGYQAAMLNRSPVRGHGRLLLGGDEPNTRGRAR